MIGVFEKDGSIIIGNGYYTLEYSLSTGVYSIMDAGLDNYVIRNAYSSVAYRTTLKHVMYIQIPTTKLHPWSVGW